MSVGACCTRRHAAEVAHLSHLSGDQPAPFVDLERLA
jgi:hypothetical protein